MNMEIAVFLGENDETISFNEAGIVKVYLKDKEKWKVVKEIPFGINNLTSLKAIRENIKNMTEDIGECKVFVAAGLKGISLTILESMGLKVWKVQGNPVNFLEYIFENEEQEKYNKYNSDTIPTPIKSRVEGKYYINLKMILESNEKVTSKQILLPFFNNISFNELEIICGHIPPWFDKELKNLNLKFSTESISKDKFKVRIYRTNQEQKISLIYKFQLRKCIYKFITETIY